ncbi:MAG: hypothetical protein L3J66_05735 [Bacteroidales bacterium]|nr:hypothetical protein [Bacteroidales bacterium]
MSSRQIFFSATAVVLALSAAAYFFWRDLNKTNADPFLFIPEDAAVILQFDQPGQVFGDLLADTTIWKTLTQFPVFKKVETDALRLGVLLNRKPGYFEQLKKSQLTISFHPDSAYRASHLLFLSKIAQLPHSGDIKAFLEQNLDADFGLDEFKNKDITVFRISNPENGQNIFLVFTDGVMLASSGKEMIERAIETFRDKQPHFSRSKTFVRLKETSGNKVDARLFIHYSQLGGLFKYFSNSENFGALDWLDGFAGWTVTDLMLKSNELLLSGFTDYEQTGSQFLAQFAGQSGSEDRTINLLPFNTSIALRQGFSDFQAYYDQYVRERTSRADRAYSDKISKYVGNEVALATNASKVQELEEKTWAIIRLNDKLKARALFDRFAKRLNGKSTVFEGYAIRQVPHKGLLSSLFGKMFSAIEKNYYVFVGDYIVFANSAHSLVSFLQSYKTGKTLDLSESYKLFSDNLSTTSNITLFFSPADILDLLPRFFRGEVAAGFAAQADAVSHFKGMAFQFCSSESALFYTNFYVNHGKPSLTEDVSQWQVSLTDEVVGQPQLVWDHRTNKYNVVVFDKSANMYLISSDGLILWKKRIDKLPLSSIYEVDFFRNGKIQYLFNTADFIYLIDRNGEMVTDFPKKLNPSATNGLSLFDYNNSRDYRLLVSLVDKWTYNYDIRGTQVKGWAKPRMEYPVREPVTRLLINNKDYIIITDERNKVKIVNRRGEVRINLKKNPDKARNSRYFKNETNSKGIILTTNEKGKLVYINTNGQLKYTDFGDFTPGHFFLYEDFDNNGSLDFIFLDNNALKVFDRFKKVIFSFQFNSVIGIKPLFFKLGKSQKVLGVVADQEKTVYLFDSKGNVMMNKGLVGETPFTVGSLKNNNEVNLITASGNTLFNYRLN